MSKEPATLEKESPYRLPDFALPLNYDLRLAPDMTSFKCEGSEVIELDIRRATNYILLNALDLEIDSAEIKQGGHVEKAKIVLEPEHERVRLTFEKNINPGQAHLTIKFCGDINDKLRGFYRSCQTLPRAIRN